MTEVTTRLVAPHVDLYDGWRATTLELGAYGEDHPHGSGHWHLGAGRPVLTRQGCATTAAALASYADPRVADVAGLVACDYFWIVDQQGEMIGFLALRHRLNEWLRLEGGHLGYSIRPSRRGRGHAARALAAGVARAAERGIVPVMVTCSATNEASRRAIEGNGGVLEDERDGTLRFWIG